MSSAHTDTVKLFCYILGTESSFPVDIALSETVGDLKILIWNRNRKTLKNMDDYQLKLWKHIPGSEIQLDNLCLHDEDSLKAFEILSSIFPDVPQGQVHVIVKALQTAQLSSSDSTDSKRGFIVDEFICFSPHWSPHADTVGRLFDILQRERLVHVCGTSGKTMLKELLHAHIIEEMPHARVYLVDSWPPSNAPTGSDLTAKLRLIDPAYPNQGVLTFLLFDEGQATYEDEHLWNTFFKLVHDGLLDYHTVLFCSYGSPSATPLNYKRGTPPLLRSAACVSLWHKKHSISLLLNPTEFNEVIAGYAKKPERKLLLDAELQDHFYSLMDGHVGALVELLHLVSYQRVKEMRDGEPFTVAAFNEENPTHSLVQRLHTGAFGRGLVQPKHLRAFPHISAFFRDLIRHTCLKWEDVADKEAAEICHHRGWVHSYMDEEEYNYYTFSSPLQPVIISWFLKPSDDMPQYPLTFELCVAVLSNFKPSQVHIPIRRVGAPSVISPLPEAQYQDEFYCSLFSVTAGNVRISPEFASAKGADVAGRIDFFIPVAKWGIEINRDGNQLSQHNSRFEDLGAYGAWLRSGDMTDYILLDCRTSVPRKCHPNIPNLFHVVFGNDYQTVTLYDNQVRKVGKTIGLLENHL